ncbi:MAG TPA: alpha/beta hydrolase [Bryobacteraceae bacterium]|nr:alpha/beta hydrolase [Bryobacteraceae bacterium]
MVAENQPRDYNVGVDQSRRLTQMNTDLKHGFICVHLRLSAALSLLLAGATPLVMAKSYENVEYSRAAGKSLQFDASVPDGPGLFPAAIIVHGGAWVIGDRKRSVQPLFEPLSNAGFAWFSISYRLANGLDLSSVQGAVASATMLGTAIDDVRAAVAYVRAHAREYHVDPNRIALIGESAGAQLALMAALKPGDSGAVEAVVALYSPSDLARLILTTNRIPDSVRQAFRGTPLEAMLLANLREQSPVTWVHKDAPPVLLIHGTADQLVPFEQSQEMCAALKNAGAECELYAVESGGHGLRWWESNPSLTGYKAKMTNWLREKLAQTSLTDKPVSR